MENLGDYIYLIALVVFAISALAKKKKKPQQEVDTLPDLPGLDDYIPEYRDLKPKEEVIYQPIRKPAVEAALESRNKTVDGLAISRPSKTTKLQRSSLANQPIENEFNVNEIRFETPDDARRAFISAEIFNRRFSIE